MSNRPDKDTYYLDIAKAVSKRSTCLKRRYGCVIVKDDVIVATGYNGSPRGEANCCDVGECARVGAEKGKSYDMCPAVHAEQNALLAVDRVHSQGATLYLSCEERVRCLSNGVINHYWMEDKSPTPCKTCFNMIKNAGIARVVSRAGEILWD